ncbi:hypothetical protein BDV19DRAFT_371223 [Aspergillus venezuelensis]
MPLSQHPVLPIGAKAFSLIAIGFGINALVRPEHALTFFEWEMPLVEALLYV